MEERNSQLAQLSSLSGTATAAVPTRTFGLVWNYSPRGAPVIRRLIPLRGGKKGYF